MKSVKEEEEIEKEEHFEIKMELIKTAIEDVSYSIHFLYKLRFQTLWLFQ